jgi:hypothetical protein
MIANEESGSAMDAVEPGRCEEVESANHVRAVEMVGRSVERREGIVSIPGPGMGPGELSGDPGSAPVWSVDSQGFGVLQPLNGRGGTICCGEDDALHSQQPSRESLVLGLASGDLTHMDERSAAVQVPDVEVGEAEESRQDAEKFDASSTGR